MEDYLINLAFSTLFILIKNPAKRDSVKRAFLKLRRVIDLAYPPEDPIAFQTKKN